MNVKYVYDGNLTTTFNITADKEVIVGSLQPNTSYLIRCTGYNGSTEGCLDITTKSQGTYICLNDEPNAHKTRYVYVRMY